MTDEKLMHAFPSVQWFAQLGAAMAREATPGRFERAAATLQEFFDEAGRDPVRLAA